MLDKFRLIRAVKSIRNSQSGFTLIELLVVTAIIAMLTGIVTVNFVKQRASQELLSAVNDTVSRIRQVQSNVLAGKEVSGGQTADAYEVVFTDDSNTYEIKTFSPDSTETVELPQNVSVVRLRVNEVDVNEAKVRFTPPFGRMTINDTENILVRVVMSHRDNPERETVLIDAISGRVTIRD